MRLLWVGGVCCGLPTCEPRIECLIELGSHKVLLVFVQTKRKCNCSRILASKYRILELKRVSNCMNNKFS